MSEALNDLLQLNLFEEIFFCELDVINLLSFSTHSWGKQRMILDLRHVKAFIYKQEVKTCPWALRFSTRTITYSI